MNLFLDYQKKIFNSLKILEKKKIIKIPPSIKNFTVELPPKDQKAEISCNAAMILSKVNNSPPAKLAEVLKKHLLSNFDVLMLFKSKYTSISVTCTFYHQSRYSN